MIFALFIPGILQSLITFFDEFIFHHRRRLPKWEVWGHPLDSLSVLIPFGFTIFATATEFYLIVYATLSLLSCAFVTKDEFVHAKYCTPQENWLHSMLFILHPLSFLASGYLWLMAQGLWFLRVQFLMILFFMIYQILYWGKPWQLLNRKHSHVKTR